MTLQPVEPTDEGEELYCKPEDVATYFEKFPNFTESTNPTRGQVMMVIGEKSDWIDQWTGNAWRERRVKQELRDLDGTYRYRSGMPIQLSYRNVRDFDEDKGDKVEFYTGSEYDDWVSSDEHKFGRGEDYWIDSETGTLYLYRLQYVFNNYRELRITYRFGKEIVPRAIRGACAKLTAAELMRSQQYRTTTPGNDDVPDSTKVAETWEEQVKENIGEYKEVKSLGIN